MINDIHWLTEYFKKFKNLSLILISYLLFFVSVILYLASLKGCNLSIKKCSGHKKVRTYFKLGVFLIISSILFGILICIKIISRSRCIDNFVFFIIYIFIISFTQGTDFAHHGTYNSIIFLLFFPIFSLISFVIYLLLYFCFKLELKKLIVLILIILYFIFFLKININCKHFYDGIGGIKLSNNKDLNKCFIKKPRMCGQKFLAGLFDVNYFRKKGCKGFRNQKKLFSKYLNKNLQKYDNFSYPRTEYLDPKISFRSLAFIVEKLIKPVKKGNSKDKEVFVTFKEGKGEIKINLKRNKSLIEHKRKLAKKNKVKFNNVYLIYFDAISRNHFMRKLKKSTKIIEKMLYTNSIKEEMLKNMNAFQFFKYHNFNGHTQGNIFPLFYGNNRNSNAGISMVKFFNERGFITGAAHNSCNRDIFDWKKNRNMILSNYDHENVAMFCDPNYEDKRNKWSIISGKSSVLRRCFYDKDSFDYNFEYILQFLEAYKEERKYFRLSIADGHEGTTEVIKYIDDSFSSFLLKIFNKYFDDKTALIILSDHGAHLPGPFDVLFYEEKIYEKYLGLLLIILPNQDSYNLTNILFNQQQFITPYDIHDTLLDMINVNKNQYKNMNRYKGQTLFLKIDGKQRSCQNYRGEISSNLCFCKNYDD